MRDILYKINTQVAPTDLGKHAGRDLVLRAKEKDGGAHVMLVHVPGDVHKLHARVLVRRNPRLDLVDVLDLVVALVSRPDDDKLRVLGRRRGAGGSGGSGAALSALPGKALEYLCEPILVLARADDAEAKEDDLLKAGGGRLRWRA